MPTSSSTPHTQIPKIQRLPENLVNQIAAGEVVERPASVIKELVENSLDANADRIEIHLTDGGLSEIKILDNGHGIPSEDLALATERHATSKILEASDLEALRSFGFRGEALSSIASVSEMELISRTQDEAQGHQICTSFGAVSSSPEPVGSGLGTQISVRALFQKVPARKKFLRSVSTEFSHCSRVIKELALGNPSTQFFLFHQGRRVHQYIASNRINRFKEAFMPDWDPLVIREEAEDFSLEAYLSPPSRIQDRGELLFFINRRSVRHRSFQSAIRTAYTQTLGPHHEPSGVVYLDIRLDWVDSNVHPQKTEVRCLGSERIYQWLLATVRKQLGQAPTLREWDNLPLQSGVRETPAPEWRPQPSESIYVEPSAASFSMSKSPFRQESLDEVLTPLSMEQTESTVPQKIISDLKYLGQVHATYLLFEDKDGLVVVDQHAIHERLRFNELRAQWEGSPCPSQKYLVPKVVALSIDLIRVAEIEKDTLLKLGFDLVPFGESELALSSRPIWLEEDRVAGVLRECLHSLQDEPASSSTSPPVLEKLIATLACHSVVRAGQSLSYREVEPLIQGLIEGQKDFDSGWTCPHGRPVIFRLNWSLFEKFFERC